MRDAIAAKLLEIRDREGLTTAALARRIGVDSSYLHLVFRGEREIGRKMLDGAIVAFPEVADVYAQSLTIRRDLMARRQALEAAAS
jgi:transcriptional regulator with XRE-family HTH domain